MKSYKPSQFIQYTGVRGKVVLIGATLCMLAACSQQPESVAEPSKTTSDTEVTVNEKQFNTAGIQIGKASLRTVSQVIRVSGKLDVPPQNLVSIAAPMGGFIKNTDLLQGMKVNKGEILVTMEDPQYIQLQESYLDTKSQFAFLQEEYKRQQKLAEENVTAAKVFQQATASFQSTKARLEALRARLQMIHLNPDKIEAGGIQNYVSIPAPINGYVTKVNINKGVYVNPTDVMLEIVDSEHLHAEAEVFEKDITKIKKGQRMWLRLVGEAADREATVYLIGKEISPDRTVRVHCHLVKEDPSLLPGMYFSASIETDGGEAMSLPESAFAHFEDKDYVFVVKDEKARRFEMTAVQKGACENGFCEVALPPGVSVATYGAFDLLGLLKNTEEE